MKHLLLSTALIVSLSACSGLDRLSRVGEEPEFTAIQNPIDQKNYKPVTMPMPEPEIASRQMNSLWSSTRQAFFEDQRAKAIGDILTVTIDMENNAEFESTSERSRSAGENAGIAALGGFENYLDRYLLPDGGTPADLADVSSDSTNSNTGSTESEDDLELKIAAVVSQILPNGNMVIVKKPAIQFQLPASKRALLPQ
jgi:flagellar L-ring protein precursor FlgH